MKPPRTYPVPNTSETRKLINVKVTKSNKRKGRCILEDIKGKLKAQKASGGKGADGAEELC